MQFISASGPTALPLYSITVGKSKFRGQLYIYASKGKKYYKTSIAQALVDNMSKEALIKFLHSVLDQVGTDEDI